MGFTEDHPVMQVKNIDVLLEEMEKMLDARQLTYADMLKRTSALYAITGLLIDGNPNCKETENASHIVYVDKAVEIITQSYAKKLKISDIATTIGISRNYLTDIFKREFDMSPQSFLMNFRMEKAAQALLETDESVQAIGISVGYADALSFSKSFKQKYGVSPSAYRSEAVKLIQCDEKGDHVRRYRL